MTDFSSGIGAASGAWYRARLGCLTASSAVFTVAVIVIGSLTPGYSQWSDAVSLLASPGEPRAAGARAAFAAYGLLVMAGASALRQYAGHQGNTLTLCVPLYGVACVVAGVAPKDRPGAPHTTVSQVHVTAGIVAGALAIAAMTLVSRCGPTRAIRRAASVGALLTASAAVNFRFTWGTAIYGLSERALLGLGMFWISALAVRALVGRPNDAARRNSRMGPVGRTGSSRRSQSMIRGRSLTSECGQSSPDHAEAAD